MNKQRIGLVVRRLYLSGCAAAAVWAIGAWIAFYSNSLDSAERCRKNYQTFVEHKGDIWYQGTLQPFPVEAARAQQPEFRGFPRATAADLKREFGDGVCPSMLTDRNGDFRWSDAILGLVFSFGPLAILVAANRWIRWLASA